MYTRNMLPVSPFSVYNSRKFSASGDVILDNVYYLSTQDIILRACTHRSWWVIMSEPSFLSHFPCPWSTILLSLDIAKHIISFFSSIIFILISNLFPIERLCYLFSFAIFLLNSTTMLAHFIWWIRVACSGMTATNLYYLNIRDII